MRLVGIAIVEDFEPGYADVGYLLGLVSLDKSPCDVRSVLIPFD